MAHDRGSNEPTITMEDHLDFANSQPPSPESSLPIVRKGSPHRRPKITYPSSAESNEKLPQRAAEAVFRSPLPEPLSKARQQQRRISRKKHGIRVSRCLPSRGTRGSLGADKKKYSLMQVSEFTEHPYWGTLRQSLISNAKPRTVDGTESRRSQKGRTQDQIIDDDYSPARMLHHANQKPKGLRRRGSAARRSLGRAREKRFGLADPVIWDAINRSLVQQRQLSSLFTPEDLGVQSMQPSEIPSRTPSQLKALNRFTRQLEKYADAAGAAGKAPVMTPTESESKMSYHTVQPLLPYRKEFLAAGLAVTSAEQSQRSPTKPEDLSTSIQQTPGNMKIPARMNREFCAPSDIIAEQPTSTSGSFVEFTPAGYPIEPLPPPKSKSKRKPTSKEKRGIFPWLRRKSLAKKAHGSCFEPQKPWQLTKDGRVQSRVKALDTQNAPGRHSSRPLRAPPVPVPNTIPPMTLPPKLAKVSAEIATPQKSPCIASPSIEIGRSDRDLCSRSRASRAGLEFGTTRQSVVNSGLGKRDLAMARLPRPETIQEERETSPVCLCRVASHRSSQTKSRDLSDPTIATKHQQHNESPQSSPSTVPSLPYPAHYAATRTSSLERALDEVSQQLDKMEQEFESSTRIRSNAPTLAEKTNQKVEHNSPRDQSQQAPRFSLSRQPQPEDEEIIFVDRKMPPVGSPEPKLKAKSSQHPPQHSPKLSPKRTTGGASATTRKRSQHSPSKEKVLPATPQSKDVLHNLDVFFDYDDANVNDRDVIKGLQVAIHAAADDLYDAMIRDKTGLRIRRFLADLRAVGEIPQEKLAEQRALERRHAEARRLQQIQDRKTGHQSSS
ncbi:hypothetical protein AAE478_001113 [Parahypoxylon ruwenzoriense]